MSRVEFAPEVRDDLDRILDHLLQHHPDAAPARLREIVQAIDVLRTNPLIGRSSAGGSSRPSPGRRSRLRGVVAYVVPIDTVFVLAVQAKKRLPWTDAVGSRRTAGGCIRALAVDARGMDRGGMRLRAATALVLAATSDRTLSFSGLGPAKIGMTVREIENALRVKLDGDRLPPGLDPAGIAEFRACHYVSNDRDLPGVHFMIMEGKVERIDISGGAYATAKGARVGSREADLRRLYPEAKVEPHPYDDAGHYFVLASADGKNGMIFETHGATVTTFRAGRLQPVRGIEGCE
jgi:plasmid stabilization system protein ParE